MLKKRYLYVIVLVLMLSYVVAQENTGVGEFESSEIVMPPGPPQEGDSRVGLELELKDYTTKEPVKDIHAYISILNLDKEVGTDTLKYVSGDVLEIELYSGEYEITLKIDELNTDGKDYFFRSRFKVLEDIRQTALLLPLGSLRGFVYQGEKAVNGADLKFECSADYGEQKGLRTDSFGSFSNEWLPVGGCRVTAEYNKKIGFKDVEIGKGEITDVEIVLSKDLISGSYNSILILGLAVVLVVIIYVYSKKKHRGKEAKKEKITKVELSSRTKDVLRTLKEKEKEVVDFLLENNYHSTQAKIRNETGIPKTTLVRVFVSLEAKNVINVEKIGRIKKIKLTDWFMGKE